MGWRCSRCTLHNKSWELNCNACGAAKEGGPKLPQSITTLANSVREIFTFDKRSRSYRDEPPHYIQYVPPPRPPPPNGVIYDDITNIPPPRPPPPTGSVVVGADDQINVRAPFLRGSDHSILCSEIMKEAETNAREKALDVYNQVIGGCRNFQTNFVDPDFPATMKSIGKNISELAEFGQPGLITGGDCVRFLRPIEMRTMDGKQYPWTVFNNPESSDIIQGALGNCWFASALAIAAERPDILTKIVLTPTYVNEGAYMIRLCIAGEWQVIVIDDYFPVKLDNSPLFMSGRKNQLWPMLIEKALAKAHGSYAALQGGFGVEGFNLLTGAPCVIKRLKEEKIGHLWAIMYSACDYGFIMNTSLHSRKSNISTLKELGLVPSHAYSVVEMRAINDLKLIRLRNPWGRQVWKGAYSDNWSGWTPELRSQLLSNPIRGAFWMTFEDYIKSFDSVSVCKIRDDFGWAALRVPVKMGGPITNEHKAIRIVVEHPTEFCFSVHVKDSRTSTYQSDVMICVHRFSIAESLQFNTFETGSNRSLTGYTTTDDVFLEPGHYLIVPHSLTGHQISAVVTIHSSKPIFADLLPCTDQMMMKSLQLMTAKCGYTRTNPQGSSRVYVMDKSEFNGYLLIAENLTIDKYLIVDLDFSQSVNVLSSRGSLVVSDRIPPKCRQMIIVLTFFHDPEADSSIHGTMELKSV